jgi:hypothetical protein
MPLSAAEEVELLALLEAEASDQEASEQARLTQVDRLRLDTHRAAAR